MTSQPLQALPLGTSDFAALRHQGQIYVDKTALIHELASRREKFLLTRPRRFGKSLLVSTFESLFKHGLRDFHGLAIESLWTDTASYQVLRLDFSQVKNFSTAGEFQERLDLYLLDLMIREGLHSPVPTSTDGLRAFGNWLATRPDNSVVLLIDEYDAPLTACLDEARLFAQVRDKLSAFYATLKSNDAAIRFFFMTGITKFNKTSIFSELNNFSDLTLHTTYANLLGYTHSEVEHYFSGHLARAAEVLGTDLPKLLSDLTDHYDGFCFDRRASSRLFAPWSLLKFLDAPEEGWLDYWFESGGKPAALIRHLKSHSLRNPEAYGREKSISLSVLSGASDVDHLSDIGLLTQAGYLTIRSVEFGDTVFVDYPNAEVRRAMARLYTEQLLSGRSAGQVGAGPIVKVLSNGTAEALLHILNRLFASIEYDQYPVRNERTARAFVLVYMAGAGLSPSVEVHNHKGRSDLEVSVGNRHWMLEFKYCREGGNAEKLLQEALLQMRSRQCGAQTETGELMRIALVFSERERQFVKWASA